MNKCYLKRLILIGSFAFLLGQIMGRAEMRVLFSPDYWANWWHYGKVIRLVKVEYVQSDDLNFRELTDIALQGSVRVLDPHSDYMTPDEYEEFRMASNQKYVGVGIEISEFDDRVIISQVFPQGTAQQAGIFPGDFIIGVDGKNMRGESMPDLSERIRGEPESYVEISVERPGEAEPLRFRIKRRAIALAAVTDVELKSDGIGYLKLRQFTDEADKEVVNAVEQLKKEGIQALIVDLRDNPGGRLTVAADIAERFLQEGQRVISIESRNGKKTISKVRADKRLFDGPLVVLINRASASASEILAGSLRDHERAILVGEKSFGKGSVQSVYEFRNGGALKLTTARYLLPKGEAINGTGIQPDIKVPFAEQDRVCLMLQRHHLQRMDAEMFSKKFGFEPVEDRQLGMALEILENHLSPQ